VCGVNCRTADRRPRRTGRTDEAAACEEIGASLVAGALRGTAAVLISEIV
jgi:hypothetical protein